MSFTKGGSKEPFSFHCVICYEFLSPHERPPVVLPCGHTYVCEQCAKRLDKCMECREPLKRAFPKQKVAPPKLEEILGWRDIQRNRQQQNQRRLRAQSDVLTPEKAHQATAETSITLPTPRNLVLVSLIESAMLAHKDELSNDDKGYESGDDDEFVRQSIQVVGSTCGTYVVRDVDGITVYDQPTKQTEEGSDEDGQPKEVRKLVCGQTVQILSLEDGVATVGRGGGYIHIGRSKQLVKGEL
jgi:Zinc finger, C3HC4 type (RING finger)